MLLARTAIDPVEHVCPYLDSRTTKMNHSDSIMDDNSSEHIDVIQRSGQVTCTRQTSIILQCNISAKLNMYVYEWEL